MTILLILAALWKVIDSAVPAAWLLPSMDDTARGRFAIVAMRNAWIIEHRVSLHPRPLPAARRFPSQRRVSAANARPIRKGAL